MVSRDKITRAVSSETVEFNAILDKEIFTISSGKTQVRFGKNRERNIEYPISNWSSEINRYLNKGYQFVTDKKNKKHEIHVVGEFKEIANKIMRKFVESIISANDEKLKQDYTKSIEEIPKECINKANKILVDMQTELENESFTVNSFNMYLKDLFTQLPIAVSKQDGYFATTIDYEHFSSIISTLQEKLDNICQQLRDFKAEAKANKEGTLERKTVLEANNLEMRDVTLEEKQKILEYMSDQSQNYVRAWHVTNFETEKRFQEYCNEHEITEENGGISHLWHGTGFENLWSIFKSGLYLNPELIKSGVRICGKAFGYGIYFAPYCRKSMGYTSARGAMYRGGSENGGYLLIFKVATGNPYYYYRGTDKNGAKLENHYRPNHWDDFHKHIPNCDVLWAEAGQEGDDTIRRLCYDEVIAYQECQATIEYVVEFSNISW
jgi:poly [ADP-ribose] polymerase